LAVLVVVDVSSAAGLVLVDSVLAQAWLSLLVLATQ
jgi:hypothetical protein